MSRLIELSRTAALSCTVTLAATLLVACGDRHTMAMKSQKAFEEAQKNGTPIARGGHGGHTAMSSDEMSRMPGSGAAATSSAPNGMEGMDHSTMSAMKPDAMKGMDMSGMKHGEMKGMDMSGMKHGDMKGTGMSGMKHGDMKGMDMSGMKHGDMKGMDMSGMKHGDMKGMDMSGMKHGDMKGMDMSGMAMTPVVPQPKALQAKPGETAATLLSDPLDRPAASSVSSAQQSAEMNQAMGSGGGMTMAMGSYVQRDVGQPSSSPEKLKGMAPGMPVMKHESPPQTPSQTPSQTQGATGSVPKKSAAVYVCASHPEIVRDQPGKCPIDGRTLVKKEMH